MATHSEPTTKNFTITNQLQQHLINCAIACESCETACLNEDNITLLARCIELTRDCADICMLGSRLVQRESEIEEDYMKLITAMCTMCAEECRKHNNEHCKACAEMCEACAEACQQ